MAEFSGYAPGTPSWVDLGSADPAASRAFYAELFGWGVRELPEEEAGGYHFFTLRDKLVAGFGPAHDEDVGWTSYMSVDDADDAAGRTEAAGGTVLMAPMDVVDTGRMAILADPTGATFGVWQAGTHKGAEIANEPVSLSWNELVTRDLDRAKAFYGEVLNWTIDDVPLGGDHGDYSVVKVDGRGVAGMVAMDDGYPPEVPSHWLAYFAVDDADDTVRRAEKLGARVTAPPTSVPTVGRFATLSGPHGEAFAVIRNE